MRSLKFRAWDNTKKEWTLNIMQYVSSSRGNIWLEPALKSHEVVLEQYTGLKDKNGKEIYEGDILAAKDGKNIFKSVEIHWDEGIPGFDCLLIRGSQDKRCLQWDRYEVIGNIHENPELTIYRH